jgi:hypothetical protein
MGGLYEHRSNISNQWKLQLHGLPGVVECGLAAERLALLQCGGSPSWAPLMMLEMHDGVAQGQLQHTGG